MKTKHIIVIIAVIFSALTFIGCIGVDSNFREVKSLVINSTNEKFNKDIEFSIGPIGISLAKLIVKLNDNDEDARIILNNISEVQVGVYKKRSFGNRHYDCSFFRDIDKKMKQDNWHFVVKHIDRDGLTGIYVKYEGGDINKLYVINVENDKLSLVRVKGDIDNILAYAIRDKGLKKISFN